MSEQDDTPELIAWLERLVPDGQYTEYKTTSGPGWPSATAAAPEESALASGLLSYLGW